jgi:hypothetical protein
VNGRQPVESGGVPVLGSVQEITALVADRTDVYVRFCTGPGGDRAGHSVDHASGLPMPGLSANPLAPPSWWRAPRTPEEWVARQLLSYRHLAEPDDGRAAWVVSGTIVERGPDNEPLVRVHEWLGRVADEVLEEAEHLAPRSSRGEDADEVPPWQASG